MSLELDLLESLESTSGSNDKKNILSANANNRRFAELLEASFNFFKKYYIKKLDMPNPSLTETDRHEPFLALLMDLTHRSVTGDAARNRVEQFFSGCSERQQKWYYRVLTKDLKIGVSEDTAIKCGFDIPKFDVMLAKDGNKPKNIESLINKGVYVSRKLDGYRCIAIFDGFDIGLYSRNGSLYSNFPQIEAELLERLRVYGKPIVLDGEIMSDNFNAMQRSAFASTRGTSVGDVRFFIFGAIDYNEWTSDNFKMTTPERLTLVNDLFNGVFKSSNLLIQVDQVRVNSLAQVLELEKQYISEGFEGAMVLPEKTEYYRGRKSNKLLKFKTFSSMECEVVGFYEGEGKHAGRLGGLHVTQENGEKCDVGSGFTDEEREYIWQNQSQVLGRQCEVQYQELTDDKVMRFPVFKRWRDNGQGTGKR